MRIERFLDQAAAEQLAAACEEAVANVGGPGGDPRSGDKPHGQTRRMTDVAQRVPATAPLVEAVSPMIEQIIGDDIELLELAYRCPEPGFGSQKLHADDVPKLDTGPDRCATVIVALTEFTETNGATRLVPGSHRRPDLQRRSGAADSVNGEVVMTGPAGTAFVFSGHVLHSGTDNRSDRPRPALQMTFRVPAASLGR